MMKNGNVNKFSVGDNVITQQGKLGVVLETWRNNTCKIKLINNGNIFIMHGDSIKGINWNIKDSKIKESINESPMSKLIFILIIGKILIKPTSEIAYQKIINELYKNNLSFDESIRDFDEQNHFGFDNSDDKIYVLQESKFKEQTLPVVMVDEADL